MSSCRSISMGVLALVLLVSVAEAGTLHLLCSMKAKVNVNGRVLGVYEANTPLKILNMGPGDHKVYCKAEETGELRLLQLTFKGDADEELKEFVRFNPPEKDRANVKARRNTVLGVLGLANEALGDGGTGRQDRRKIVLGAAAANELLTKTRKKGDREWDPAKGNGLIVEAQVPLTINLQGVLRQECKVKDPKTFAGIPAGRHKLFLRNEDTGELRQFEPEWPEGEVSTVTIKPAFAPPDRDRTNEKSRRRNALAIGALANELFGRDRSNQGDIRKGLLAGVLGNEFLSQDPSHYYRKHAPVVIDLSR